MAIAEADPEQPIKKDATIGRNLKRNLDNRIRQLLIFYPLLANIGKSNTRRSSSTEK